MKPLIIVGVCLLVIGGGLLAYRGFSYTQKETVLKVGPLEANADVRKNATIPTPIAWVTLGVGVVLIAGGLMKTKK